MKNKEDVYARPASQTGIQPDQLSRDPESLPPLPSRTCGRNCAGLTLIEIMVSLIILAVSLLGIAGLQGLSTRIGNNSYYRSQAVNQAYDILERMRANPVGVSGGSYRVDPSAKAASGSCLNTKCSASDLAAFDLGEWNAGNGALLPSGSGSVVVDGPEVSVVVSWIEASGYGKVETKSIMAVVRL